MFLLVVVLIGICFLQLKVNRKKEERYKELLSQERHDVFPDDLPEKKFAGLR